MAAGIKNLLAGINIAPMGIEIISVSVQNVPASKNRKIPSHKLKKYVSAGLKIFLLVLTLHQWV